MNMKDYEELKLRDDAKRNLGDRGRRLREASSNDQGQLLCDFCGQVVGRSKFPDYRYEACTCASAVAERAEYERAVSEEMQRLKQENRQKRIDMGFQNSKMPNRWKVRTFERFDVTAENEKAFQTARAYADGFTETEGNGLLLMGPVGTGKTHLAAAIAIQLLEREYSVVFGTFNSLLSQIRYSYTGEDKDGEQELFRKYTQCDLLVIDDFGKERVSEWVQQMAFEIINTRYENDKALVITTNMTLAQVGEKYRENGDALVDRLLEICKGIKLEGESWRVKAIV